MNGASQRLGSSDVLLSLVNCLKKKQVGAIAVDAISVMALPYASWVRT